MVKHRTFILPSIALYWVLSGCSLQSSRSVAAVESAPELAPPAVALRTPPRPFPTETLYSLLAAEFAGNRAQYDVALSNYTQQARETGDPQVAERATLIARYLNDYPTTLEMAKLWAKAAPHSQDALANASLAHLQLGQLRDAFGASLRLLNEGGEPLFQTIAASAASIDDSIRTQLLADFARARSQHPKNEQLLVGSGILLQQSGDLQTALTLANETLLQHPNSIPAAILEASLLHQLKRDAEAIAKMAALLERYPDNSSLRKQYARILTHHDMTLAQEQFAILSQQERSNGDMLLSLGIIALERKDLETARNAFEELLNRDQHIATAHYYLGRMAEANANLQEAIMHYLQVSDGNDFLSATLQVLDIFVRQKDFTSAEQHMNRVRLRFPEQSEAIYVLHGQALIKHNHLSHAGQVFNEGLAAFPNSTRLLFARAMLNNQRRQLPATERDLRQILQQDSNNVAALNSLGYILADRTQRYSEAYELLDKALRLKPDDAAIIDSMGWLHYRRGNYPEALRHLQQAYETAPGAEIGAHLGEILWVLGDKTEARRIWREAQQLDPNDPAINETLNRLKADL